MHTSVDGADLFLDNVVNSVTVDSCALAVPNDAPPTVLRQQKDSG